MDYKIVLGVLIIGLLSISFITILCDKQRETKLEDSKISIIPTSNNPYSSMEIINIKSGKTIYKSNVGEE